MYILYVSLQHQISKDKDTVQITNTQYQKDGIFLIIDKL